MADRCDLGGNQRDQDRLKAQKKAAANKTKPKESASSLAKRKEACVAISVSLLGLFSDVFLLNSDAEILRAKQKVCCSRDATHVWLTAA